MVWLGGGKLVGQIDGGDLVGELPYVVSEYGLFKFGTGLDGILLGRWMVIGWGKMGLVGWMDAFGGWENVGIFILDSYNS